MSRHLAFLQYYRMVIKVDPVHADALGNLANLLADVRKDRDAAAVFYARAVKADMGNADNLVSVERVHVCLSTLLTT